MIRLLRRFVGWLLLLAVALLLRSLGRALNRRRNSPRTPEAPRVDGAMVRDRVCNTFFERERALRVESEGVTHFFCSEACRQAFLAGRERERRPA